jgi:hypothetical protein
MSSVLVGVGICNDGRVRMELSSPTKAKPSYASCRRDEGGIPRASESGSNAVGYGVRRMGILGVRSGRAVGAVVRRDETGRVESCSGGDGGFDGMMAAPHHKPASVGQLCCAANNNLGDGRRSR